MRTRVHRYKFATYNYRVVVIFTKDVQKECAKRFPEYEPGEPCKAFTLAREKECSMVLPWTANADDIAHECFHVIWAMMKHIGAKLEEEVVAYHIGHLVGMVTNWKAGAKS